MPAAVPALPLHSPRSPIRECSVHCPQRASAALARGHCHHLLGHSHPHSSKHGLVAPDKGAWGSLPSMTASPDHDPSQARCQQMPEVRQLWHRPPTYTSIEHRFEPSRPPILSATSSTTTAPPTISSDTCPTLEPLPSTASLFAWWGFAITETSKMPPRSSLTSSFSITDANNEVVCPLRNQDASSCRKRCIGVSSSSPASPGLFCCCCRHPPIPRFPSDDVLSQQCPPKQSWRGETDGAQTL